MKLLIRINQVCIISLITIIYALSLKAATSETFDNISWMLSEPYAPVIKVLDTESSLGPYGKNPKTITLEKLVQFHGHPCDGLILAACALNIGLKKLYPSGIVDRTDTGVISNNSPCFGDVSAYLSGGRIRFGTQKIDSHMGNEFIVHRFSTGKSVRISLKQGIFPKELTKMETLIKKGAASLSDVRKCQQLQIKWIKKILSTNPLKLFNVEELSNFKWISDNYEHIGKRGDVLKKTVDGLPNCLTVTENQKPVN